MSSTNSGGEWDIKERIKRIPAFVRGMVVKKVEEYCRKRGVGRVRVEQLEALRSKMPRF